MCLLLVKQKLCLGRVLRFYFLITLRAVLSHVALHWVSCHGRCSVGVCRKGGVNITKESGLTIWAWRFLNGIGHVYITAQKRLFPCTCLHSLLWKFSKQSALGEPLPSTRKPLIAEEKNPVSESLGKHSLTNWSLMRVTAASAVPGRKGTGERCCSVVKLLERHNSGGKAQTPAFVCKFPTTTKQLFFFFFLPNLIKRVWSPALA